MPKKEQAPSPVQKQPSGPKLHQSSEPIQEQLSSEQNRLSLQLPRLEKDKPEPKKSRIQSMQPPAHIEKLQPTGPKKPRQTSLLIRPAILQEEEVDIASFTIKPILPHKIKIRKQQQRYKDLPFFLLFILTWLAMIGISYYGLKFGNIAKIVYPIDSFGNQCGKNTTINNENLHGMNLLSIFDLKNTTSYRRCVVLCPGKTQSKTICKYGITPQTDPVLLKIQLDQQDCISPSETVPIFQRCVPKNLETMPVDLQKLKIMDTLTEDINRLPGVHTFFNLLYYIWSAIVSTIGLSIVVTLFWFLFIQTAGFMLVIFTLIIIGAIILGITAFFGFNYYQLVLVKNSYGSIGLDLIDSSLYNTLYLGIAAIIGAVVFLGYIGIIYLYRKRIAFSGKIVHETGKALVYIGVVPILGVTNALCISTVVIYSIIIAGELVSSIDDTIFYRSSTIVYIMLCYLLFWFLWTCSVIFIVGRIAVADTVSAWYWRKQKVLNT
jgi:hypothetical protein